MQDEEVIRPGGDVDDTVGVPIGFVKIPVLGAPDGDGSVALECDAEIVATIDLHNVGEVRRNLQFLG